MKVAEAGSANYTDYGGTWICDLKFYWMIDKLCMCIVYNCAKAV